MSVVYREYQEKKTVRFDWIIKGLKQIFDSSKGDAKAKPIKSCTFDEGRWQILFYPNAGTENGQFISLYLSSEPRCDEKEGATDGRWSRVGKYDFVIEVKNVHQTTIFSRKEASEHTFAWNTMNWGWAQFARRDVVYYSQNSVRLIDAFMISCTITKSPVTPTAQTSTQVSIPGSLLNVFGSLLDDPTYSDVVFLIPRRGSKKKGEVRKIYAARAILKRYDYFESMFNAGFAESNIRAVDLSPSTSEDYALSVADGDIPSRQFEDSDDEEEFLEDETDGVDDSNEVHGCKEIDEAPPSADTTIEVVTGGELDDERPPPPTPMSDKGNSLHPEENSKRSKDSEDDDLVDEVNERNVRLKVPQPENLHSEVENRTVHSTQKSETSESQSSGSDNRIHITVKDVAYSTYRAVLLYLYTDRISFAPLSSSFCSAATPKSDLPILSNQYQIQEESQNLNPASGLRIGQQLDIGTSKFKTRSAWIEDWERQNPGKVKPCSAKAVYRVADKLGIKDLKRRAFQHITKSLTVHNIPYELFSSFSSIFEEVRKVQIRFFLDHWNEIRASESMKIVWQQIRVGRHPGFEEVWPLIAANLEYKPQGSEESEVTCT